MCSSDAQRSQCLNAAPVTLRAPNDSSLPLLSLWTVCLRLSVDTGCQYGGYDDQNIKKYTETLNYTECWHLFIIHCLTVAQTAYFTKEVQSIVLLGFTFIYLLHQCFLNVFSYFKSHKHLRTKSIDITHKQYFTPFIYELACVFLIIFIIITLQYNSIILILLLIMLVYNKLAACLESLLLF